MTAANVATANLTPTLTIADLEQTVKTLTITIDQLINEPQPDATIALKSLGLALTMRDRAKEDLAMLNAIRKPEWEKVGTGKCDACERRRVRWIKSNMVAMVCKECMARIDAGCSPSCIPMPSGEVIHNSATCNREV